MHTKEVRLQVAPAMTSKLAGDEREYPVNPDSVTARETPFVKRERRT